MNPKSLLLLLAMLLVTAGCSNGQLPTYEVRGQLKFEDGTVPKFGDIEFYNAEHKINARGKINRDGSFTVSTYSENDGAVAGKHQVMVMQQAGHYLMSQMDQPIKHDHGKLISTLYFDYRTSGIEVTIKEVVNEVTITLELEPKQTEDGLPLNSK